MAPKTTPRPGTPSSTATSAVCIAWASSPVSTGLPSGGTRRSSSPPTSSCSAWTAGNPETQAGRWVGCAAYWLGACSFAAIDGNLMAMGAPGAIAGLPGTPGVYRFRDARGGVLYIGRATALRSRVASYWSDLRERGHLAPMVARVTRIEAVTCDSPHEAALLERNLLEASLPPWNRTPGGQENLVYIRMDKEPRAPGLTVDHLRRPAANVQYFGPYLGGLRARQAIAALHRILPLCYTGTRLRGAQLDIARARGFAGADRAELISTLI